MGERLSRLQLPAINRIENCDMARDCFAFSKWYIDLEKELRSADTASNQNIHRKYFLSAATKWFVWSLISDQGRKNYLNPIAVVDMYESMLTQANRDVVRMHYPFIDTLQGWSLPTTVRMSDNPGQQKLLEVVYAYMPTEHNKTKKGIDRICNAFAQQQKQAPELFTPETVLHIVAFAGRLDNPEHLPESLFALRHVKLSSLSVKKLGQLSYHPASKSI